ncbi:MAG TPA: hypothetical protein VNJ71_02415 [Gemmatimonadales bacterium]|jgi:hypothetical protein|nr:hypothetical protein [Gemmatimonadales bacterium]
MEGTLFVLIVFGGGMLWLVSRTAIGQAIAERIRGGQPSAQPDPALLEELDRLRAEVAELSERMDFAERLLAAQRDSAQLPGGESNPLPPR